MVVALREILTTLVLVFLGNVEEMGMAANEAVGGGGRGGGAPKGIKDVVDANSFAVWGKGSYLTGICEPDLSAKGDSDLSDKICTAVSAISIWGWAGEDGPWGMTVVEECSVNEALVFGTLTLEGDNRTEVDRACEGESPVVSELDWTLTGLECTGTPNSFSSFRTTVEDLMSPEKLSNSSSSRVSKNVSGSSEMVEISSCAVWGTVSLFSSNQSEWLKISSTLANSSMPSPCFSWWITGSVVTCEVIASISEKITYHQ
jgi:hypothetical protein